MKLFEKKRRLPKVLAGAIAIFIILVLFIELQPLGPSVQRIDPLLMKVMDDNSDLLPNSLESMGLAVKQVTYDRRVYINSTSPWEGIIYLAIDVQGKLTEEDMADFLEYSSESMYVQPLTFRSVNWECGKADEMGHWDNCGNNDACEAVWVESGYKFTSIACGEGLKPTIEILTVAFNAAEDAMWYYRG